MFKAGDYDLNLDGKDEKAQRVSFGKRLKKQQDRVIGGYQIVNAGTKQRAQQWQLRAIARKPISQSEGYEESEGFDTPSTHMREDEKKVMRDAHVHAENGGRETFTTFTAFTTLSQPDIPIGSFPPFPAYAQWHNADHDEYVTVTGVLGEHGGVIYLAIEGSQTGIPAHEVEFL